MTYFYSKENLELIADSVNKRYYHERLEKILPLDPYDLLEKLGLEIEWKFISPNFDLLGMIFFEDSSWFIWDNDNYELCYKPHLENFKKGTILINSNLLNKKYAKSEAFVVGHEVCHWIKDVLYFKNHPTDFLQICSKESINNTTWNNSFTELDVIERQTNYLAALFMPRNLIKLEFFKRLRYKNIPPEPIEYKIYMRKVIKSLADDFNLNYNPILYRLYDLNILKRN